MRIQFLHSKRFVLLALASCVLFSMLAVASSASPRATGAPIVIGVNNDVETGGVGTSWPMLNGAVNAAVLAVNKAGGINGRPLQVMNCDPKANAVTGQDCAQRFVSAKVAAVCCSFSVVSGTVINPILEQAGIANFGLYAAGGTDYTSPIASATGGASVLWGTTAGQILKRAGTKKVYMLYSGSTAGQSLLAIVKAGIAKAGLEWVGDSAISPSTADMSPFIAAARSAGADSIITGIPEPQGVQFYVAKKLLGANFTVLNQGFGAANVRSTGTLLNDNIGLNAFPPAQRGYIKYWPILKNYFDETAAAVKAGDKQAQPALQNPAQTLRAWMSIHQLAWVLRQIPRNNITSATVLAKLKTIKALPTYGFGPALDLTKTKLTNYPRVFYSQIYENASKDGHFVLKNRKAIDAAPLIDSP